MIKRGHFLPGGTLLTDDKGVNETYRGTIEVGPSRIDAYVKLMSGRQLVNELAASVLGRLVGLRMPRAFLVLVRQSDYSHSPAVQAASGDVIAFATEAVGSGSALRRVTLNSPAAFALFLKSWKEWPEAATFDEWIANADRHPGNVLIGQFGEVWLIDHSHAFTGPSWNAATLNPLVFVPNQLCDHASKCISLADRFNAYAAALNVSALFAVINAENALRTAYIDQQVNTADFSALASFVALRASKPYEAISVRLGLPGLSLGAPA